MDYQYIDQKKPIKKWENKHEHTGIWERSKSRNSRVVSMTVI